MSGRERRWIVGVALAALAAGALLAVRHFSTGGSGASADVFFAQSFKTLDGELESMERWKGRTVVLNFWATWCAPCVEEMPDLQRLHGEYERRGITVVGLGIDSPSALRRFRDEHKLTLPLYAGGAGGTELGRSLGNGSGALPFTVVVDARGRIVWSHLGQIRPVELKRVLDAQAGPPAT